MNILHIDSSPRLESHSRALSAAIVEKLLEVVPTASITRRDIGADPLPQTTLLHAAALASPATLAAPPAGSLDLSEILIGEVEAADMIVIGTPMHNLTIPSVLKAWIDQILRVGRTMKSTPAGKVGLLHDRPVFIGVASGAFYTGERANQPDFLTPYLSLSLSSIGLKTQQFFPLQGTAFLDWEHAALARQALLPALDLSVVPGPGDIHAGGPDISTIPPRGHIGGFYMRETTLSLPQIGDRMSERAAPPLDVALREWIGPAGFARWSELRAWIDEFYPGVFVPDWLYGGKNRGWTLRYKKTKALTTLVPEFRRLSAIVVMGRAERERFEERRYAWRPELVTLYDNARTYVDGKWLTLPVSDGSDLQDVKDLLLMKRSPVSNL